MSFWFASDGSLLGYMAPKQGEIKTVNHPVGTKLPLLTSSPDVSGFSATAMAERRVVAGLPDGINVEAEVLAVIAAAKRLDVWLDKGRRVQVWADDHGIGEECWVDEDSGALQAPAGAPALPAFVAEWISEAPEIGAIIDVLGSA
jgi:hypothetical protein